MERFSEAVELAKIDVVPKVMISGAGGGGSQGNQGSVFEALLALVLSRQGQREGARHAGARCPARPRARYDPRWPGGDPPQ